MQDETIPIFPLTNEKIPIERIAMASKCMMFVRSSFDVVVGGN
jgi:hypothetical protein